MDNITENQTHLKTLTEGIHSKEALQLVREHVLGVMGPASMAYSSSLIKMAKLQVCLLAYSLLTRFRCLHALVNLQAAFVSGSTIKAHKLQVQFLRHLACFMLTNVLYQLCLLCSQAAGCAHTVLCLMCSCLFLLPSYTVPS